MQTITGYLYYPDSLIQNGDLTYFMARTEDSRKRYFGVLGSAAGFEGGVDTGTGAHIYPLTPENARVLRSRLPGLNPQPLGVQASAGFGDRLGLATPGHALAAKESAARGERIAPIFAQQSVRENARTHRTPQQVMDDAMWGVFQAGWREPWGADADHLKTPADLDSFFDAGFTFFTIDPGDYVDNEAHTAPTAALEEKMRGLPWEQLRSSEQDLSDHYLNQVFQVEDLRLTFDETSLMRAAAKYGKAIAHSLMMANHLAARAGTQQPDLEVSVDETETPTSVEEHYFIAAELRRLGVRWTSLAPRFIGRFEKGVDYLGDLDAFEASYRQHAAIARHFGYRLSLHSGSDKFSIYAIAARHSEGLVHLKTAGTSYLEALRVVAQVNPAAFREMTALAIQRYEIDKTSYHVSADLAKVPPPGSLDDEALPGLLDQFDARQIFHVTFGITLEQFGPDLVKILQSNEDTYIAGLAVHFKKHLEPLAVPARRG
jgi:tagaturonate epimerase